MLGFGGQSHFRERAAFALTLLFFTACGGGGEPTDPPRPTSIELASPTTASGVAGTALAETPSFRLKDQNGSPMIGVPVSVIVEAGGGSLAGAPTQTSIGGVTSVGTWTLGPTVGENRLAITVAGVTPLTITISTQPGPPAKFINPSSQALTGTVGEPVGTVPEATLADTFNNPIPSAEVTVSVTGGGTAAATTTSSSAGRVQVPSWTLGTIAGSNTLTFGSGAASVIFTALAAPGAPATLTTTAGNGQSATAGSEVLGDILVEVKDKYGNKVAGKTVTFAVSAGGGSLAAGSAMSNINGVAMAPKWRLGKRALPQSIQATLDALSLTVIATVSTNYQVEVRFFGPAMTEAQRALFTSAAARVSAIITGDVPNVQATNYPVATSCSMAGEPPLTAAIDDIIIFASIASIDGPGKTLARAGPCAFRAQSPYYPAIGSMQFDDADLASMAADGTLEDVIIHEMLHVVGVGVLWQELGLLVNYNTPSVSYTGTNARQGCVAVGGSLICSASVPVENTGGTGTFNNHWRESVFGTELMTGYANSAAMPISSMTIGGLADLGYGVNGNGADAYQVPSAGLRRDSRFVVDSPDWETRLPGTPLFLTPSGTILRRDQVLP